MPSPRHFSGRRPLLASLTGSERGGKPYSGARPRAVAPGLGGRRLLLASLTGSERGGKPYPEPGLVPSPCRLGGRRLLLASLTGSEKRGDSIASARPRAVAPKRHDDMFLSQTAPGGEDSSIRLASSSTMHSMTEPVPRASMAENAANAILGVLSWRCS